MTRKSTRAHDHAVAPLSPAVDSPRTRGVFYRKGSGRAKLGLRVFSERDPQPLGSKTAIARCPILLGLALHRRRRRVLDLEPVVDPAGTVRITEPLRDDALATE